MAAGQCLPCRVCAPSPAACRCCRASRAACRALVHAVLMRREGEAGWGVPRRGVCPTLRVDFIFYFLWSNVTNDTCEETVHDKTRRRTWPNMEVDPWTWRGTRPRTATSCRLSPQRPFFSTMTGTWRRRRGLVGPQRAPSATPTSKRRDAVVAVMSSPGPPCRHDRHGPLPAPPRRRGTVSPLRVFVSPLPAAT